MIYFIQDESLNRIKIGFTAGADAVSRMGKLQTGCPSKLTVLCCIPGSQKRESELHQKFHHLREQGEWFRPGADLIRFIARSHPEWIAPSVAAPRVSPKLAKDFLGLMELDPDLLLLLRNVEAFWDRELPADFCANAAWYGYPGSGYPGIRRLVYGVAGWGRKRGPEELQTHQAYDIVYQRLYEGLPDCREGCACTTILNAFLEF